MKLAVSACIKAGLQSRPCIFDLMTMWSLEPSAQIKILKKRLRSYEGNKSCRTGIKSKHPASGKTDVLRLTECNKKVKIAKN